MTVLEFNTMCSYIVGKFVTIESSDETLVDAYIESFINNVNYKAFVTGTGKEINIRWIRKIKFT